MNKANTFHYYNEIYEEYEKKKQNLISNSFYKANLPLLEISIKNSNYSFYPYFNISENYTINLTEE